MKLVETEFEHSTDDDDVERPVPPRPERRRVYVSLIVTLSVLTATVVLVYSVFPKRDNELLDAAIDAHAEPDPELSRPTRPELEAWTVGVLGRGVQWPAVDAEMVDTYSFAVLGRKAAAVRFRIGGALVSLGVTAVRSSPPRTHRRARDGLYAVSWRHKRWTFVAVGPSETADRWTEVVGAP